MAREIPEVVRAVAGLAATVLDEARRLPATLPGLPVRLIGQALQASLKLQQHYSSLVARGDEVFTGLRGEAEPGLATFDDDLPAPPAGGPGPYTSAFDRVGNLPTDTIADDLADDLAVADLPVADPDDLSDEVSAAVLIETLADGADDMSSVEVSLLPDDPAADAVTAVVDELAEEVAEEVLEAVLEEVLEDLSADTVDGGTAKASTVDDAAVEEAVVEELIADAAVGGTPPNEEAAGVPSGEDTPDQGPEQTQLLDDDATVRDIAALDDAAEELVDLGGPEAAESVTPGSTITDSSASDPLVATADQPDAEPAGDMEEAPSPTSPVEDYDTLSIPALRGRLRAYPAETVADLLEYERATRARAPYVTLLQNRLEKLSADRG